MKSFWMAFSALTLLVCFNNCSGTSDSSSPDSSSVAVGATSTTSAPIVSSSNCSSTEYSPYALGCQSKPSSLLSVVLACPLTQPGKLALIDANRITIRLYKMIDSREAQPTPACDYASDSLARELITDKKLDLSKMYDSCRASAASFDEGAIYRLDVVAGLNATSNVVNSQTNTETGTDFINRRGGTFYFGHAAWAMFPNVTPQQYNANDSLMVMRYRSSLQQGGYSFSCGGEE